MNEIIFIKDIVEDNGKTVFENNMALKHNIPIDTLVEVKFDKWCDNGACLKIHARLWVYKYHRDCDGEPLYAISEHKKEDTDLLIKHFGKYIGGIYEGFSEESLTPIDVTPNLICGHGALKWNVNE